MRVVGGGGRMIECERSEEKPGRREELDVFQGRRWF